MVWNVLKESTACTTFEHEETMKYHLNNGAKTHNAACKANYRRKRRKKKKKLFDNHSGHYFLSFNLRKSFKNVTKDPFLIKRVLIYLQ